MAEEIEFDGGMLNDDGEYGDNIEEYDDEDELIDDHANQDEDIDKSWKVSEKKEEDDDQFFELNYLEDTVQITSSKKSIPKRKTSGYPIISFTEHTKLYSILCDYLSKSKIDIPVEMENEEEVKSCDIYRIARFWIANRRKYNLPLTVERQITGNNIEKVDVNDAIFHDDLDFHDDNNDEYRFYYNFNSEPYNNAC